LTSLIRRRERLLGTSVKFLLNFRAERVTEPLAGKEPLEVIVRDFCERGIFELAEGHNIGAGMLWSIFARSFCGDQEGLTRGVRVTEDAEESDGSGLPLVVWGRGVEGEVGDIGEACRVHGV
jgi:hypothetical protein